MLLAEPESSHRQSIAADGEFAVVGLTLACSLQEPRPVWSAFQDRGCALAFPMAIPRASVELNAQMFAVNHLRHQIISVALRSLTGSGVPRALRLVKDDLDGCELH